MSSNGNIVCRSTLLQNYDVKNLLSQKIIDICSGKNISFVIGIQISHVLCEK